MPSIQLFVPDNRFFFAIFQGRELSSEEEEDEDMISSRRSSSVSSVSASSDGAMPKRIDLTKINPLLMKYLPKKTLPTTMAQNLNEKTLSALDDQMHAIVSVSSCPSESASYSLIPVNVLKREFEQGFLESSGHVSMDDLSEEEPDLKIMFDMLFDNENRVESETPDVKKACAELSKRRWSKHEDSAQAFGGMIGSASSSSRTTILLMHLVMEQRATSDATFASIHTLLEMWKSNTGANAGVVGITKPIVPHSAKFIDTAGYQQLLKNGLDFVFTHLATVVSIMSKEERIELLTEQVWFMPGSSKEEKMKVFDESTEYGKGATEALNTVVLSKFEQLKKRLKDISFGGESKGDRVSCLRNSDGSLVFGGDAWTHAWPACFLGQV